MSAIKSSRKPQKKGIKNEKVVRGIFSKTTDGLMGGEHLEIEIDESMFGRRKFNWK